MLIRSVDEIIGWYGVAAILVAYSLISLAFITSQNLLYILFNITGSIAILYNSYKKKDYQPVVLNIIWGAIALIALVRLLI